MPWVLRETVSSENQGKPIYFQVMTPIGPRNTPVLKEAFVWDTKEAATLSPAMKFSLTVYEAEEIK